MFKKEIGRRITPISLENSFQQNNKNVKKKTSTGREGTKTTTRTNTGEREREEERGIKRTQREYSENNKQLEESAKQY